jgi:hypothetical protein
VARGPDTESRVAWPAGWAPDPGRFRSESISAPTSSGREARAPARLVPANRRRVPSRLGSSGASHPGRSRPARGSRRDRRRPAQIIPLLTLHLSAVRLWPTPLRRAVQSRVAGVRRGEGRGAAAAGVWRGRRHGDRDGRGGRSARGLGLMRFTGQPCWWRPQRHRAVRIWSDRYGVGPWACGPDSSNMSAAVRGTPTDSRCASPSAAFLGNADRAIEPLDDQPYAESLATRRIRPSHPARRR